MSKQREDELLDVIQKLGETAVDIHNSLIENINDVLTTQANKDQQIQKLHFYLGDVKGRLAGIIDIANTVLADAQNTDNDGSCNVGFQIPDEYDEEDGDEEEINPDDE